MKPAVILGPTTGSTPYGVARGTDTEPAMIDFRGHNGTSFALPYAQLGTIAFHPTDGITMEFRDHRIAVHGRNLRPLYDHLLNHRVTFLLEEEFDATPESETFVDAIVVERVDDEA